MVGKPAVTTSRAVHALQLCWGGYGWECWGGGHLRAPIVAFHSLFGTHGEMARENNGSEGGTDTKKYGESCRVAFLAFGSIGDSIPMCALAASLGTVDKAVVLAHSCHASILQGEEVN